MNKNKILIIEIASNLFGLKIDNIKDVFLLQDYIENTTKERIRGLIKTNELLITLFDIRKILKLQSLQEEIEEFDRLLLQNEQNHINWVNSLINSINEDNYFDMPIDPLECDFGKWYYSYNTSNLVLQSYLPNFDEPHRKIHQIGKEILDLKLKNKKGFAHDLIRTELMRELSSFKKYFKEFRELKKNSFREFAIVFDIHSKVFAIAVDKILSVNDMPQNDDVSENDFVYDDLYIGSTDYNNQKVNVLNEAFIIN